MKSRRSWVAGGRQEGCCLLNKARKGACSPGKKSRCEMPRREPASYSCRDLKVSVVHRRWRREKKAEEETGRGRQKRRGEVFKAIDVWYDRGTSSKLSSLSLTANGIAWQHYLFENWQIKKVCITTRRNPKLWESNIHYLETANAMADWKRTCKLIQEEETGKRKMFMVLQQ